MTGQKRYDEDAALDAAMRVFWEKGYVGSSISDLERATGLNKSSLYNAYKSKDRLFEICLERFSTLYSFPLTRTLEAPRFVDAVSAFFDAVIAYAEDPDAPNGCLATMASMEAEAITMRSLALVRANQEMLRRAFADRGAQAVRDGELAEDTDCEALGAMLVAQVRGVNVLNKGTGDASFAREAVSGMIAMIAMMTRPA